jgi:hypothetical protein
MSRTMRLLVIPLILCAMFPLLAEAQSYRWSLVRVGGKEQANTVATGTNDAGWIVGNYIYLTGNPQQEGAFRLSKNKYTEFDVPGVEEISVWVEEIGKSSTIVGTYQVEGPEGWTLHAFLYRHGMNDHIIIDVPGAFWTFPTALNDLRQVGLGYYYVEPTTGETKWGAAVYDYPTNTYTPVTVFGYSDVLISGINNHGELVGNANVHDADGSCGCVHHYPFYRTGGQDHLLQTPHAPWVHPMGMNDHGVMVGGLLNGAGFRWHLKTGAFEEIRHPTRVEGFSTWIEDIDNTGRMVAVNERWDDGYTESWWVRPQ